VKFESVVFEICQQTNRQTNKQADSQTDRQTDTLIVILRTPTVGKEKNIAEHNDDRYTDPVTLGTVKTAGASRQSPPCCAYQTPGALH